jgi:hypothetical protein
MPTVNAPYLSLSSLPPHRTLYLSVSRCSHHPTTASHINPSKLDMSQSTSGSSLELLINAALQDYTKKAEIELDDHPLFKQLEKCNSVDSISSILQEQIDRFHEFRGKDGKITKSLTSTIHVLYTLSTSTTLSEAISLVCPKSLIVIFSS